MRERRVLETYNARVNTGKAVHWFTNGSSIPWCGAGTRYAWVNWGIKRLVRPTDEMVNCKRCISMVVKR